MLKNWLKIAFTQYKKNWLSTVINLFGLTIGLTGFMLILMHWQDEESYEVWNPGKENIYFLENGMGKNFGIWSSSTQAEMRYGKEKVSGIQDYLLINPFQNNERVSFGSKVSNPVKYTTSDSFFRFFPFKKLAGSYKDIFKNTHVAAISAETAQQLFGNNYQDAVGKTIVSDQNKYVIAAVYELPKGNSVIKPGLLVRDGFLNGNEENWGDYNYAGFFMIKPNADITKVNTDLNKMLYDYKVAKDMKIMNKTVQEYEAAIGGKAELFITRLDRMKLEAKGGGLEKADKKNIYILLGLSVIIVLLSAINFINLKTAQASQRAKEVGVRRVMGGTTWQLTGQFLLETLLICMTAYLLATAFAEILLPAYNKFLGKEIKLSNANVFIYSLVMLLITSIVSGLIPAVYLANFKPINTLKGNFSRSKHGIWLRNGILTIQLVISSFFIISILIINAQVNHMLNKNLGFNGDQVINIDFLKQVDKPYQKYELLRQQLPKIKGVEGVTYTKQRMGMGSAGNSNVNYMNKSIMANHGSVDLNFFKFFEIKIVEGRDFDPKLSSDTLSSTIVNQAFIKEMGWTPKEAIGKEVRPGFDSIRYKIVGVAQDYNQESVANKVASVIYFNYGRNWNKSNINNIMVKLSGDNIPETISNIQDYWQKEIEPGYPFQYQFLNKQFAKTYDSYKKQRLLFSILNAMVLVVALLGLFALSSLMIDQKLKDVAIKKTLGASDSILIKDLTKRFLLIATLAVFLSIPLSYYFMNEWLKDFAYRIEMPWWPYVMSLVILLLLTFFVVSIKAYRATKVDLVKYLKYE
ncbi:ABC transporter permease [Elizabethkingia occulta]|uniref:Antibiotic ABC transporter permease n=1 Tax=Elizabethkingia occulta TaxID=1867263 RepID=A0A1T3MSN5_9FLAO|nr:ABC transporter permease [Elizabethkingia occulta]OPB92477.1 antibiotic ABC transporter permease [Elizabethkingia occulta]OPC67628.1 antibiotic ABC transporter permease [Elizabethkingia occulta]